jgi:hypothetical protein
MTFRYIRDRYFHSGQKDLNGNTIPLTSFMADPYHVPGTPFATGELLTAFEARSCILDGRYAVEVRKKIPDPNAPAPEQGQPPAPGLAPVRVICHSIEDDSFRVEVFENDFWNLTTPPNVDLSADDWANARLNQSYTLDGTSATTQPPLGITPCQFVNGRILRWMGTTPGEAIVEMAGYTDADHYGSVLRPKVLTWQLRDDRSRIMGLAMRTLGLLNNVQVTGELVVIGATQDTTTGLGWVNYPNKGLAAVKKLTYNFGSGFQTELELFREEARVGEMPVPDKERQDKVTNEIANIKKIIDVQKQRDSEKRMGGGEQSVQGSFSSQNWTGGI